MNPIDQTEYDLTSDSESEPEELSMAEEDATQNIMQVEDRLQALVQRFKELDNSVLVLRNLMAAQTERNSEVTAQLMAQMEQEPLLQQLGLSIDQTMEPPASAED